MAVKYRKGGGNWNALNSWTSTDNGTDYVSAPGSSDDVRFWTGVGSGDTVTMNVGIDIKTLDFGTWGGTLTGGSYIAIYGTLLYFSASMNVTGVTGYWNIYNNATCLLTSNTRSLKAITIDCGATMILQDALTCTSIRVGYAGNPRNGTLTTNDFNITCSGSIYTQHPSGTSVLNLGNSTITCNDITLSYLTTVNAGTSSITITGNATTLYGYGDTTFYDVTFTGTGNITLANRTTGTLTFNSLNRTGSSSHLDIITTSTPVKVSTTLLLKGASAVYRMLYTSNTMGTSRALDLTGCTVSGCEYLDFKDISFSGSPDFSAIKGGSGDCLGNTGATLTTGTTIYWGTDTASVSDVTKWFTDTGLTTNRSVGGEGCRLPQDNATFIAGSFTANSKTVTVDVPRFAANVDFSGINKTSITYTNSIGYSIYGNFVPKTGLVITQATGIIYYEGRGTHTLGTAGIQQSGGGVGCINSFGGTYSLSSNYNGNSLYVYSGTFDANDYNFTTNGGYGYATLAGTTTYMGNGTWLGTAYGGDFSFVGNVYCEGSTITINTNAGATGKSLAGGGHTFNNLIVSTLLTTTISGNNTFANITLTGNGKTILFTAGSTTTVTGAFSAISTTGQNYILNSTSNGSTWNLVKTSGIVSCDYITVRDSVASGGATFYMGYHSTSTSGNSGWLVGLYLFRVKNGTWALAESWAFTSGGSVYASTPAYGESVIFDAGTPTGTTTITSTALLGVYNFTDWAGTINGSGEILCYGNFTFSPNMTQSWTGGLNFRQGNMTFTSNGKSVTAIVIYYDTTVTLGSALTVSAYIQLGIASAAYGGGNLNTANYNVTCAGNILSVNVASTSSFTLGSSTITCANFTLSSGTATTVSAGTSSITITGNGTTLYGYGNTTFYDVTFTGTGNITLANRTTGILTFNKLYRTSTASHLDITTTSTPVTVTNEFKLIGNSAVYRTLYTSSVMGTPQTLNLSGCTYSACAYLDFKDITFVGSPNFTTCLTGGEIVGGSGDCLGNTGATLTTGVNLYWGSDTGNVSDSAKWWLETGHTNHRNVGGFDIRPLPQDSLIINSNSISTNGITITIDVPRICKDLTYTGSGVGGRAGSIFLGNSTTVTNTMYGSITFTDAAASSYIDSTRYYPSLVLEGRDSHTINITKGFYSYCRINSFGGTYTLQATLTLISSLELLSGTFNDGNYNVNFFNYVGCHVASSGTLTRTFTKGTGTYTFGTSSRDIFWDFTTSTNLTFTDAGTIVCGQNNATAKIFQGGGKTYNNITLSDTMGTNCTFVGNNTITNLTMAGNAKTVLFKNDFINQGVPARYYNGVCVTPTKDIYISVIGGDIYKQTGGTGAFNALNQTLRNYRHMCVAPNGNVYVITSVGDIYMQTAGVGTFNALNQTSRTWFGCAAAPNGNIYACEYGGDIYMQTNGTGNFVALNAGVKNWVGIHVTSAGDVYAGVSPGDIYKQTGGTGTFNALSQTSRGWSGISSTPDGNVFAAVYNGDIYIQLGGTGNFIALGQTARTWCQMASYSNNQLFTVGYIEQSYYTDTIHTINSISASSTAAQKYTLKGSVAGRKSFVSRASGIVELNNLIVQDLQFSTGALWYLGKDSTNTSGNVGAMFTDRQAFFNSLSF